MTLYWQPIISSVEFQDWCSAAPGWEERKEVSVTVAGRDVTVCTGYELLKPSNSPPLPSVFARIPLDGDAGFVTMFLTEAEGDAFAAERALFAEILASLRVK